jgi:hypothetical protein
MPVWSSPLLLLGEKEELIVFGGQAQNSFVRAKITKIIRARI